MSGLVVAHVDGTKSVRLEDLPEEAWRTVLGTSQDGDNLTPEQAYKSVPWVYRAVSLRAQALADLPWAITRLRGSAGRGNGKGAEVVSSEDYREVAGLEWLGKLPSLLYHTELSLCLGGAAYWMAERQPLTRDRARTVGYRWLAHKSITPQYDAEQGLLGFKRRVGTQQLTLDTDEVLWWWLPDPEKELGPGTSPVQAALCAAGLVRNVDTFGEGFFKRGATTLTLLTVEGNPAKTELDRLEAWWKRLVAGVKSAWTSVAIRSTVKPVVLGSPPKDLAMTELTEAKQRDVAVALGVPFTLLFSEASNRATAEQDELNFWTFGMLPEAEFIEQTLNERLFRPQGLEFQFQPNKLEVFERRESEKAYALIAAWQAGLVQRAEWREQMDLEITPEDEVYFYDLPVSGVPVEHGSDSQMEQDTRQANGAATPTPQQQRGERQDQARAREAQARRAWRTKALRALKAGKSADVPFDTDALDEAEQDAIRAALEEAMTADDVRAAFHLDAHDEDGA